MIELSCTFIHFKLVLIVFSCSHKTKLLFQDYDPDMPPELAAAAGIHDIPADNTNPEKSEVGQSDISMASLRARPQFVCTC